MRFDLVDLKLFLLVAQSGSITLGAERAGLALPSASARIKGMEDRAGVPLLERRRRGVVLRSAGHALVRHAQAVQGQLERMIGELGQHAKGLRGSVRLLSNTAAAVEFVPEVLASFLAEHDTIDVVLEERPSQVIAEAVASGNADLGIAAEWADLRHLEQRPFRTDRLVVLASRTRRELARTRSIEFAEIASEPFVGLSPGSPLQEHIIRQAARVGCHLSFRVRLATLEAVCEFASRGIGLAVVPESAARRYGKDGRPHVVPLRDDWATRRLILCARQFEDLSLHAKLLADALAPLE